MEGKGTGAGLDGRGEIGRDGAFGYEGSLSGGVSARGTPPCGSGGGVEVIVVRGKYPPQNKKMMRTYDDCRFDWCVFVY